MKEENFIRVTLRIPKALHETLAANADRKTSTTNAEVVSRLEKSIQADELATQAAPTGVGKEDLMELKNEIESMLDRKLMSLVAALSSDRNRGG